VRKLTKLWAKSVASGEAVESLCKLLSIDEDDAEDVGHVLHR
jgi:hypothetical protein